MMSNSTARKQEIVGSLRWMLASRLVTLILIFVSFLLLMRSLPPLLFSLLLVNLLWTLSYLLAILFLQRLERLVNYKLLVGIQICFEILVEVAIIHYSGGLFSPFLVLLAFTILSSALMFELTGALLIAGYTSLVFGGVLTLEFLGILPLSPLTTTTGVYVRYLYKDIQFILALALIYLLAFFLMAFIAGYLSRRLGTKGRQLEAASRELVETKLTTTDILDHITTALVSCDNEGRIVYYNEIAEKLFAIPSAKAVQQHYGTVFSDAAPFVCHKLSLTLAEDSLHLEREGFPLENVDWLGPNDQVYHLLVGTSRLLSNEGQLKGVLIAVDDLTELRSLEDRIQEMDKMAIIGELSAGLAHEIRNPLSSIAGSVELIAQEAHLSEESQNLMRLIIHETERLNRILGDFLNFAWLANPDVHPFSLAPILTSVTDQAMTLKTSSSEVRIALDPSFDLEAVEVLGDPDSLRQVLLNVIKNAVEASDKSTCRITIRLLVANSADMKSRDARPKDPSETAKTTEADSTRYLELSIVDNGPGIPEEMHGNLFKPFQTTKQEGSGLGLAISRKLIEKIGGSIAIESKTGEGTTVRIRIPLVSGTAVRSANLETLISEELV